jgi:hypothetical protein
VTGGCAEEAWGGVEGGLSEFGELDALAPAPLLPATGGTEAVVAPALDGAWCPGRALPT